jgi:glycosyltransferase involved in cell wall biosynthesis
MHVHGVYLANSIWAYLASRMIGTPYVLQPHGTLEPYQEAQNRRRKSVFNRLIGQRILAGASALVATSTAEASNLRMAQPGATVVVIPLGAAAADPSPTMTADAVPWRAVPRESRVIFLGRFAAKKRLDVLLDAWNRLDVPGHLVLAGPEEDWTWPDLRDRLGHTRTPTVTYLGTLDEFGVAWALEQCGTLVLPSENENFGLVVPEAMIHGCAVLTTIQTASSEHVRTAAAGIVLEEPTIESVTQALRLLLTSPDRVRLMGQAAQTHARASLTWEASALRLKDLYASTRTKGN